MRQSRFSYSLGIDDSNTKNAENLSTCGSVDAAGDVSVLAAAGALGRALNAITSRLGAASAAEVVAEFARGFEDKK